MQLINRNRYTTTSHHFAGIKPINHRNKNNNSTPECHIAKKCETLVGKNQVPNLVNTQNGEQKIEIKAESLNLLYAVRLSTMN